MDTRRILYNNHLGLVYTIASKLTTDSELFKDLIVVGEMALWEATKTFDSSKNVAFSTYVYTKIWSAMCHEIRDNAGLYYNNEAFQNKGRFNPKHVSLNTILDVEVNVEVNEDFFSPILQNILLDKVESSPQRKENYMMFVMYRILGYTCVEISKEYKLSPTEIFRRMKSVQDFLKSCTDLQEWYLGS